MYSTWHVLSINVHQKFKLTVVFHKRFKRGELRSSMFTNKVVLNQAINFSESTSDAQQWIVYYLLQGLEWICDNT